MSHITKVGIEIKQKDIKFLKKACEVMGLNFAENQTSFKWYGSSQSKCAHAIRVPGANYEIGVVQSGDVFNLELDNYGSGGLKSKVGNDAHKLVQRMGAEKAKHLARMKGYSVTESFDKDTEEIVIKMTVN